MAPLALAHAENAPVSVPFRSAPHPDFDRIVFDTPRGLAYKVERVGDRVRLIFDAPFSSKMGDGGLTRVKGLSLSSEGGHAVVSFNVAARAILKDFRSGPSVVMDVYGPAAPASEAKKDEPKREAPTQAAPPPAPAPAAPPPAEAPKKEAPVALTPAKPKEEPATPSKPPVPEKAKKEAPAVPAPTPAPVAPANISYAPLDIKTEPVLVATLDARVPTGAVVYARGGYVTILFDRKILLDAAALAQGGVLRVRMEPIDLARNSGFRFEIPPGVSARATRAGTAWQIFLTRQKSEISVGTEIVAQPAYALGARLLVPTTNAPEAIRYVDPVIGDALLLSPLRETIGFSQARRMADFTLLPSAQGVVIKPETDGVVIRPVSDGVEITAEGGLKMSSLADRNSVVSSNKKTPVQDRVFFNIEAWRGRPGATFTETRQQLQQTIVDVPDPQKPLARFELARFYFAHGMAEEALALLGILEKQVPDILEHPDYIALRGATRVLAGDTEIGLKDLAAADIKDMPEIELWQAVGAANQRNWAIAEPKFAMGQEALQQYPEPFFSKLQILAVEAALAAGKDEEAAIWLDKIVARPHDANEEPAIKYLQGALAVRAGKAETARTLWREVVKSDDRLYKIRAELGLVDLGVATHSLSPLQAIERLEGLRFAWRGDELELDILHRLGLFYFDAKNYKTGLATLQQALRYFPNGPWVEPIKAEMQTVFRDLFLSPKGKDFSPIEALSLYQDYKDLKPAGDEGNKIQLALAEKLVSIDLLDQACSIMTDLVKNGLKGEEKVRVGTRVAAIRLLDHKPDLAMAALDMTQAEAASVPQQLQAERTVLRARAFAESKKYDQALDLLNNIDAPFAKSLKADILMKAARWPAAAQALIDLAGPAPAQGKKLTKDQASALLGAAIAGSLANDNAVLDRLAVDYGAAMAETEQADTFHILTRPEKTLQTRDIAAAQARLSEVDVFRGFLDGYRKGDKSSASKAP